ncbi:hypothetical protein NFJ02_32g81770 [Pycnococcus provasolii]
MPEVFDHTTYGLPAPNSWRVAEITNDLEPKDLIRTQRDVSSLILAAIQEEPEGKTGRSESTQLRHYDGLRSKYNLWDKAVRRNFATVGLLSLDKVYKNDNLDKLQPRNWSRYFSKSDRALIYNALLSVKVEYHENPAPAFTAVERILRDYFE